MTAPPKRRAVRITHLNAATVPVEQALAARAEALEQQSMETASGNELYLFVAAEFRLLADELHYWG